ncbi:MAG TPA: hypothetical protein VEC16_04525 [Alphaproteobacteria bacterium]|nr:hypothetical protein [Alphaproteobacteria bacterium]
MAMVGFSFTKINAERKPVGGQALNIESNANISGIKEMPVIDPKKTILKFEFAFTVKYSPEAGKIELGGEIVEMYDKDFGSKVVTHWNTNKKLHPEVMQSVFNVILSKCNTEAIIVSRDLGLPSPVQMPRVDIKPKAKDDAKAAEPKAEKPAKAKK